MKNTVFVFYLIFAIALLSCETDNVSEGIADTNNGGDSASPEGDYDPGESAGGGTSENGNGGGQSEAGKITAAEWNDLDNWSFWQNISNSEDFSGMSGLWGFYPEKRISVKVRDESGLPINNIKVEIRNKNSRSLWISRTDNLGFAELWPKFYDKEDIDSAQLVFYVNDRKIDQSVKSFQNGINEIILKESSEVSDRVELNFIVDATGSMSDELEFLKEDLKDVIEQVQNKNNSLSIFTSTVFYRDEGDDYVTKYSGFTDNINSTISYISQQKADGGGDFPEAVHSALDVALNDLQWSTDAKTRIAFLLLDAPPHEDVQIIDEIQSSIKLAAEKGIKVIPVTASGINKETEFLMRYFSIATNGTYVFITNDSGIGNEHLEATVGEYEVELLNDLMVRLITKYSE